VINEGRKQLGHDLSDQETAARLDRISRRLLRASSRQGTGPAAPLRLELTEALLICHDLFMLGLISRAPSLKWDIPAAEAALCQWSVSVLPDGALTEEPPNRLPTPRSPAAGLPAAPRQGASVGTEQPVGFLV
jgi:hypothetical protein